MCDDDEGLTVEEEWYADQTWRAQQDEEPASGQPQAPAPPGTYVLAIVAVALVIAACVLFWLLAGS